MMTYMENRAAVYNCSSSFVYSTGFLYYVETVLVGNAS